MNRFFVLLMSVWTLVSTCGRTPETILYKQFGIVLSSYNYSVELFNDYICPNGDGQTELLIKIEGDFEDDIISNISQIDGIKRLPVPDSIKKFVPKVLQTANEGYYYYERIDPEHSILDHILFICSIDLGLIYYHELVT